MKYRSFPGECQEERSFFGFTPVSVIFLPASLAQEMVLRVLLKTVIVHKASSVMMLLLQASHTGVIVFYIHSNSENE